jgi:hypothetical protein
MGPLWSPASGLRTSQLHVKKLAHKLQAITDVALRSLPMQKNHNHSICWAAAFKLENSVQKLLSASLHLHACDNTIWVTVSMQYQPFLNSIGLETSAVL